MKGRRGVGCEELGVLPRRGRAGEGELEIALTTHSLAHTDVSPRNSAHNQRCSQTWAGWSLQGRR